MSRPRRADSVVSVQSFPVPTRAEQCDFLLRLYFGANSDPLGACVHRAYLDLNRTIHGLSRLPGVAELRERASRQVRSVLVALAGSESGSSQNAFDAWHRDACERLCATYAKHGFPQFGIGQAQKWLNMAFKYVHVFGEKHVPGFARLYAFGHVPLDNIMLDRLRQYGAPRLSGPWSRLRDYREYLDFQHWIRQRFPDSTPLAVEFHLWQGGNRPAKLQSDTA